MNRPRGVLRRDLRPGPLYLPWRTTSRLIGNLRDVGSIDLPSKSNNAVMVGGLSRGVGDVVSLAKSRNPVSG